MRIRLASLLLLSSLCLSCSNNTRIAGLTMINGEADFDSTDKLRFEIEQPPLADGRFHLRFGLADADGGHIYHWLDDALTFVVYPSEGDRGMMRIDGRWTAEVTVTA